MLSNAYFLAKFRFDTAENEPAKNLQNLNFAKFANFADQREQRGTADSDVLGPCQLASAVDSAVSFPLADGNS